VADEHWERVKALYETAAARPARERAQFLAAACADDELRHEVQALLDQPVSAGRLRHVPAAAPEAVSEFVRSADLLVGRRIGSYEVRALVGRGGMGEVYCARDTKLGRDVAIKVLPRAFTADPDRPARFEREARVLAALNHPNIAIIHGIEDDADGVRALVLELVEGETLADRIARGRLALIEALTIARQLVEALDAAHEKGIVHRDLKPANIKITPDGAVKVLDFGLAKAVAGDHASPDLTQSPTVTAGGTSQGIILGTPAYMSPEQARGQTIDKRTDIWAFGCVLYEMLTGRAAFPGHTVSDTIAAILEREPDWQALPARTPPPVRRLLSSCVEKEPKRRLRDIGDARIDLEDALAGRPLGVPQPAGVTRRTAMSALAGATVGAAATGVFAISRYRGATPGRLTRFAIAAPAGDSFVASFGRRIAVSPDGTHLAYVAANPTQNNRLYLRSLSDLEPRLLLEGGGQQFFSPDGGWIGFVDVPTAQLRKIGLTAGGAPVTVCRGFTAGGSGGTWADGDIIYFIGETPGSLLRVAAAGGQPDEAAKLDFANGERVYKFPCALPGGNAILLTVATADTESFDDAHIVVFVPATGQKKVLVEGGTHPRYSPSGHLVYARNGNLLAVSFDPNQLVATGQPFTVLEGVLMSRNTGVANFDVSVNGDLAYLPGRAEGGARSLVWVNRDGTAEKLPLPPRSYLRPRISPDSHKLAIEIEGSNHDIYVYDFASEVLSNITTNGVSHWPVWSPDGHAIGYRSGPMGAFKLWQVPADRSHAPRQLQAEGVSQSVESYSPDGRVIAYTAMGPGAPSRIMLASTQGDESVRPMDNTKYVQGSAKFSPDGRWLAFCSNESKTPQVYVQAFPGPGPKIQVSTDGGTDPVWKRSGEEIFYRKGDSMMVVPVSTAPSFTHGRPQELWKGHYSHGMSSSCGPPGATSSNYDVMADGQRFLMIKDDDQDSATSTQIVVVLGWSAELNRVSKT
jgi:eukaryotic-like serine/threonine-protein kinase